MNDQTFEARIISMMGKPKTAKIEKAINRLVGGAGPSGALTDPIRKAFKEWRNRPVVAAQKEQKAPQAPTTADTATAAPAQPATAEDVLFVIELMMKQKTSFRKNEVHRRVRALKRANLFSRELREAHNLWRQVPIDGTVSKDAAPATPEQETAPVVTEKDDRQKEPVEPKAPEPVFVLKGTTHPKGEPSYSPFAALLVLKEPQAEGAAA